jgi:hypothetical protein
VSDQTEPVSRKTIARKLREGMESQGWMVVGLHGSWEAAAERICEHLERKGIEVKR